MGLMKEMDKIKEMVKDNIKVDPKKGEKKPDKEILIFEKPSIESKWE